MRYSLKTLKTQTRFTIMPRVTINPNVCIRKIHTWSSILRGQYFLKGPCINRAPPIKLQHVLPCQSVIKIMKCLYCLNCPKFGQLIISKIIRCQILGVKMHVQNSMSAPFGELTPLLRWCSLQRSPDPLAAFNGPYF